MYDNALSDYIDHQTIGVVSSYQQDDIALHIALVDVLDDHRLKLTFHHGHQLTPDHLVTIHLDNRTGISEYDAELKVYRTSFKGKVTHCADNCVWVEALEYQVFYGISVVKEYRHPTYEYPQDDRPELALPVTPLTSLADIDIEEKENKLGVLVTRAPNQPHTTVMAFLSSVEDDVFFITFKGTFKQKLLAKDRRSHFAIDSRATFTFDNAIEWNYSLLAGEVYQIPHDHPLFAPIKELFIAKNPWEMGFFSHPAVEMFHFKSHKLVCPKHASI